MKYVVAYEGRERLIVWALDPSGKAKGREFFEELPVKEQVKLEVLFRRLGDTGVMKNKEQLRKESDDFWCFKRFKNRLMCFMDGRLVVITHGFRKKSDKLPRGEVERARVIRRAFYAGEKGA